MIITPIWNSSLNASLLITAKTASLYYLQVSSFCHFTTLVWPSTSGKVLCTLSWGLRSLFCQCSKACQTSCLIACHSSIQHGCWCLALWHHSAVNAKRMWLRFLQHNLSPTVFFCFSVTEACHSSIQHRYAQQTKDTCHFCISKWSLS